MISFIHRLSYLLLTASLLVCCSNTNRQSNRKAQPVTHADYYPAQKVEVNFATGFDISYHEGYKRLDILNPYQDQTDTLHYILIPRGANLPEYDVQAQVIETPVRSMIATSTTHVGLTNMLEENSVIKGITQPEYVYNKEIRRRLEQGEVEGFSGSEFNKEQALALNPQLIMVSGGQASQFDNYRVLLDSGINLLVNSEWLEQTPLGKAEWVKMMGALLNKESLANRRFNEVIERYQQLKNKVENVAEKPLVINNMPYKGAWFVSGGDSFTAQFLKDAGADYSWYDTHSTGGLRLGFEAVYEVGLKADIWINPGSAKSLQDILAQDSRFKDFKSFKTRQVFNNNRRLSESGGNDFWETGVVHPERILADLIKIIHPTLLPDHELYYYQKLD
ncbi:ABC transporter substrate-binding protein [Aliifodinibius sp. S!AR15-10]|uniref:ABC transporter substrate-binding protein n=1 Tax=Aliifodinibius sp. S!AR15-10 TaxID=2950437 RepID=UPI002866AC37|nr:ABC transporter substrate-binding protein [Aliifodinibius sp. S!AR15-10]MDR8391807.1 ABC transporter substrate-binding protein [Aliifodinibius sp. S!AR15-10]